MVVYVTGARLMSWVIRHRFHGENHPVRLYRPSCPNIASETWAIRKQDNHEIRVAQCEIERAMLGVARLLQVREGLRGSELR